MVTCKWYCHQWYKDEHGNWSRSSMTMSINRQKKHLDPRTVCKEGRYEFANQNNYQEGADIHGWLE